MSEQIKTWRERKEAHFKKGERFFDAPVDEQFMGAEIADLRARIAELEATVSATTLLTDDQKKAILRTDSFIGAREAYDKAVSDNLAALSRRPAAAPEGDTQ